MKRFHFHLDEHGTLVKCYHKTKNLIMDYTFWIATIIAFPLEHFIWEKVYPFNLLTKLMGL
jgi:hypothetical protein